VLSLVESKLQKRIVAFFSYIVLIAVALMCVIPFLMVVSASFSNESELITRGYGILPRNFTMAAYKTIIKNPTTILNSYKITIFVTAVGSTVSILMSSMAAYALSRSNYKLRKGVNVYFFITMIFHAGMVPSYLLFTKYFHFTNNILALILPSMFSVSHTFILRTFFKQTSESIIEAAKIDGLGEIGICFRIAMPVCKTGIATILLFKVFQYWNSWYECMMYMTDDNILTLQYYLHRTMSNIEQILKNQNSTGVIMQQIPTETTRMAMCTVAVGPMVIIFMFFQKYFIKGISVGSVKG